MVMENNKYILAKYDVSGIQSYIFATNRLRENAGASFQVTRVLDEFLPEAFREAALLRDVKVLTDWKEADQLQLPEYSEAMAELIYIGGGNAMALFRDRELFRKVGQLLGIKVAHNCMGIDVAAASIDTDLSDFAADRDKLDQEMERVKRKMIRQPLYSPFPVVEQDNLSHLPVTCRSRVGDTIENVTEPRFEKIEAYKQIRRYQRLFPEIGGGITYEYPESMDQLCRDHGEDSRIAIVHIDGNGMGERIRRLMGDHESYTTGVPRLRNESMKIARLFQETYGEVLNNLWKHEIYTYMEGCGKEKNTLFPLRPMIMDGDDFTFLCQADLAVPLAVGFMSELMRKQQDESQKITACAGMVFVNSHFPFYVAYTLAEESCARAKEKWYSDKNKSDLALLSCYLDYRILKESEAGLTEQDSQWQQRPYSMIFKNGGAFEGSIKMLYETMERMEDWPSRRLHRIYRALTEDNKAVELLKREFISRGYNLNQMVSGNWEVSSLFDALELRGMCRLDLLKDMLYGKCEGDNHEAMDFKNCTKK